MPSPSARTFFCFLATALLATSAPASPDRSRGPDGVPPPHPDMARPRGPGPGPGPWQGHPALHRWMEHLERSDPAEAERLRSMLQTNPRAFRHTLRQRILGEQLREAVAADPELQTILEKLPPEDRARLKEKMIELGTPSARRGRSGSRPANGPRGVHPGAEALQPLVQEVHEARSPEERRQSQQALRNALETQFDAEAQRHRERIEELQRHLETLSESMRQRASHREAWIDQRLEELLRPPPR